MNKSKRFLLRKKFFIDKILQSEASNEVVNEVQLRLLQAVYEIAKKRYHQIKMSFDSSENLNNYFLSLEFEEKSMLYLRVRALLEVDQIEMIMSKDRSVILAFLSDARMKMIQHTELSGV